jgi:hypothetical protein
MIRIAFITFVFLISACSKDDILEQSSGTKLISIEYTDDNRNWLENYYYSNNGKLEEVQNFYSLGRKYSIEYEKDQIKEYSTYKMDENKLIFRDSILYNPDGTIQAIHNFSINSGEDLPLSWIYEYEYDIENRVSKKLTYYVRIQEYTSIEKYYWNGDNIERAEYYNGDEELYYEYFYKYDDKLNYKKAIPTSISDPINWAKNNVTEMNWNDYYGNLDLDCQPCIAKYKYNLDNYPVSIEFNWGRKFNLKYE